MFRTLLIGTAILTMATPAFAAIKGLTAPQAVAAFNKSTTSPSSDVEYAMCMGYWYEWGIYTMKNFRDPFISNLPDNMKSTGALMTQLHWQEKTKTAYAGTGRSAEAQALSENGRAAVSTAIAENNAASLNMVFETLGRCKAP